MSDVDAVELEQLLTAEEVARVLALTERYVWRLARAGDLPYVQVGKYRRFKPSAIQVFIKERTRSGPRARVRVEQPRPRSGAPRAVPRRRGRAVLK